MKIALIVPSTTRGLDIDDITDTHLYKILIQSLSKDKPKKHKITIYVGYKINITKVITNLVNKYFIDIFVGIK